jgi:hypothetical protein
VHNRSDVTVSMCIDLGGQLLHLRAPWGANYYTHLLLLPLQQHERD